ncbi:MAG: class I SAM-dependent methyltransferase [Terracidiphilus sp.]|jgi:phospholipid N-methyltransferase
MGFLQGFKRAFRGGYFEGDPLDPMAPSTYGVYGYNSVLYTIYSACIRPYITSDTVVLEVGPGRGAWSKTFLRRNCRKLYAIEVADAEHTHFWDYIGEDRRVEYIVVDDLSLPGVPDDAIDFFFSFGVFCHLRPEMCEEYLQSIFRTMKHGSRGFLMIADFDKYESCRAQADLLSIGRFFMEQDRKVWMPAKLGYMLPWRFFRGKMDIEPVSKSSEKNLWTDDGNFGWYHWGTERACEAMTRRGFQIVEPDVEACQRDPVIHFRKP